MTSDSPQHTSFEDLWLIEAVRLQETAGQASGRPPRAPLATVSRDDPEAVAFVRARARTLAATQGWSETVQRWRLNAQVMLALLAVLAIVSGASAALGFFGNDVRRVNVVWTLTGLIGVHLLALVAWLVSGRLGGGFLGRLWFFGVRHLPGGISARDSHAESPLMNALAAVMTRNSLGRWTFATISHSLWLLALTSTLVGMVLALSLRSVSFGLETTILGEEVFHALVNTLGWLPSRLGFALPDAAMVAGALGNPELPQPEEARRAWASWLCGALVVYALLPRLCVWALSVWQWRRRLAGAMPSLTLPGLAEMFSDTAPTSRVIDAAPPQMPPLALHAPHTVAGNGRCVMALELGPRVPWPPARGTATPSLEVLAEVVDSREQRHRVLAHIESAPPRKLLVACDAQLSPDRGTLQFLVALSAHAGQVAVWVLCTPDAGDPARMQVWRTSLEAAGLPRDALFLSEEEALHWVNTDV